MLRMIVYSVKSLIHMLAKKGGQTSYKTIILFILMQRWDFVSILIILTPSGQDNIVLIN